MKIYQTKQGMTVHAVQYRIGVEDPVFELREVYNGYDTFLDVDLYEKEAWIRNVREDGVWISPIKDGEWAVWFDNDSFLILTDYQFNHLFDKNEL